MFFKQRCFVQGNWLLPMLEVFKTYEKVGMVGMFSNLSNSRRYDHMGVVFTPQGNPRHYGQGFFHRPFKGKVKQWSAVTAACCITVKENFLAIGGFDEVFVNGCEDVDLCLRMTEKGLDNYCGSMSSLKVFAVECNCALRQNRVREVWVIYF